MGSRIVTMAMIALFLGGCFLKGPNRDLQVFIKLKRPEFKESSLLVLNLKEPDYAAGKGILVGECFHKNLLQAKKFKMVAYRGDSTWNRIGTTEEDQLLSAVEEAKNENFGYVLVGEIKEYLYGGVNKTKVRIKIRIIEVNTKITIFMAENFREDYSFDRTYPMKPKLSDYSQTPLKLTQKLVRELVGKI